MQQYTVTLKNLVKRIENDQKYIATHPKCGKVLNNRINRNKELIIQCVMENKDNPLLGKIEMAGQY